MDKENLGPAERIIQSLLTFSDHMVHNRPGLVVTDNRFNIGVRWTPVTYKEENGLKVVYALSKAGKKTIRTSVGCLQNDNQIVSPTGTLVGKYKPAGMFPEVALWMYRQVAEVWKLDNEFAAKWASYAYGQEHRDLKVVLAAFMLVQGRKGDPVVDGGKVAFHDEDYRDIGEAMLLLQRKDGKDLNPKLLLRIHELLTIPEVAAINRELGFGRSARKPFLGRWTKAVEKWLNYREENTKMLDGLVRAGFRQTVMELCRRVGYKPVSPKFFETLRWKQSQSVDGRRELSIGVAVKAAESWEGLSEEQVCQKIVQERPGLKRIVGLLPKDMGLTRAIVAAAIEANALSDKDLVIFTPTLEDLGLLQVQDVRERWERAVKAAEDMRAANIALRVRSKETQEKLQEGADKAAQKIVEEVMKGIVIYFIVDISGSMTDALPRAKVHIAKFLQAFPLDKLYVSVFNTAGREVKIQHASAAGVENAFRGIQPGGGTDYGSGIRILQDHNPGPEEDALFFFIGDEGAPQFSHAVTASGLSPVAFALVPVMSRQYGRGTAVRDTATRLGIPCFEVDEETFSDPYAIPRTIRNLIAATPLSTTAVRQTPRVTLIDTILRTELLKKPAWAA